MARKKVTSYSFDPLKETVTLTGLSAVVKGQIVSVRNLTTGQTLYLASDAINASVAGKVLSLPVGTVTRNSSSTDKLDISYDDDPYWGTDIGPEATDLPSAIRLVNEIRQQLI